MTPKEADSVLGEGPQILIYDASMIPHKNYVILLFKWRKKITFPSNIQ